jgi:hypothetical protein
LSRSVLFATRRALTKMSLRMGPPSCCARAIPVLLLDMPSVEIFTTSAIYRIRVKEWQRGQELPIVALIGQSRFFRIPFK